MKTEGQIGSILRGITHFFTFFLLIAFVITCCTMLFVTTLAGQRCQNHLFECHTAERFYDCD